MPVGVWIVAVYEPEPGGGKKNGAQLLAPADPERTR
jgi:hypothetical protein